MVRPSTPVALPPPRPCFQASHTCRFSIGWLFARIGSVILLPPLADRSCLASARSSVDSFAPVPLQDLHRSYGSICHHQTRQIGRPRGGSTCAFRSNRDRWFLLFRDKASSKVLPPLCRIRCGQLVQSGNPRTCPRDLTAPRV